MAKAKAWLANLSDGSRLTRVPWTNCSWERGRNQPESMSITIPTYTAAARALDLKNIATFGKTQLVISEGDTPVAAGAIGLPEYDASSQKYSIPGRGIWDEMNFRNIMPPSAYGVNPSNFLIPDPADPTKTAPNPAYGTYLSGLDLGSIAFSIVRQSLAAPNGALPIVVPDNRPGTHVRNWDALNFKSVGTALTDLTEVINGPDIRFSKRWKSGPSAQSIEFVMEAGTQDQPILRSASKPKWTFGTQRATGKGLKIKFMSDHFGTVFWGLAGAAQDTVLMTRSDSSVLQNAGFPLRDRVISDHGDVERLETLQGYSDNERRLAQFGPLEIWEFKVLKNGLVGVGDYDIGDLCQLRIKDDPIIKDGNYEREIVNMAGDGGPWITIQTAEVYQ